MNVARRVVSACLLALALVAIAVPASAAELTVSEQILFDYATDRVIDGQYDARDLETTLDLARDDPAFREFAAAVQETYDRDILGLSGDSGPAEGSGLDLGSDAGWLPQPRGPGERDQPPWPFLALTALAGALVVTGAGSSILRRARR